MSSLSEKKVPYFVCQPTELNVAKRQDSRLPSVQSKRSKKEERSISAKSNSAAASSDKRFRPSSDGFQWRRSSSLTSWSLPVPRPDTHSGHRLTVKNLIFHRKSTGSDRRVHFKHDLYSNSRTPSPCSTLEDFEVHRPRFQAISGPKRFSEGDVLEARHQQSLDAADQKSHLNKFRNVTKATIFRDSAQSLSNRLKGRRISEIDEQLTMDVRGEGRRGTVHGSQLYVVSDGGRLSRRIDEPISKQRLSTLLSATLKAKEEEKKNMLRRLQTVSRVVGRVCALQKIVMQRNANDTVYQSQLKDIGSSPVNEKNTYGANRIDVSYFKANRQMRMSQRGLQILSKPSDQRTTDDIRYATNALRNVKYIAEFPLRIQESLARVGYVECYEPKRFIVKEGGAPENAYIVLYGSIVTAILDDHKLSATSIDVLIKRGQPFGEIGVFKNQRRGGSNITNEYTEVLRIPAEEYKKIFMGGVQTNPVNDPFLMKFGFLRHWPLKCLKEEPGKYFVTYFQRNVILTRNSNKSDWIYLVKEGSLRVLKRLEKVKPIVSKRSGEYTMTAHPSGYFSFLSRTEDFDRYVSYHDIRLPSPLHMETDYGDEYGDPQYTPGTPRHKKSQSLVKRLDSVLRPHTTGRMIITPGSERLTSADQSPRSTVSDSPASKSPKTQASESSREKTDSPVLSSITEGETPDGKKRIGLKTIFTDLDVGAKTENDVPLPETNKETEWVHVQTLTKDQTFGLQYVMFEKENKPQPSFVVISNGAEVVQISRSLFISKLDFNARERLRSEVSPYPTDDELQSNLTTRVNWEAYKDIVLHQIICDKNKRRPSSQLKYRPMKFNLSKHTLAKSVYS
ncbi:uncharacterized protein LOC128157650 isoform X6 [Crassostrea angulata]|uniref:uncharacterized protein LOC128157650 isoform X6 n=1 Tax=Magallana angulata TaxID=2784310 RepID=UPI0022B0CAF2|nr:uncharacterized protein LOC128157650 isoform X6 [Crassostrea angulata]